MTTFYQFPLCRWHCRKCRRGRRTWRPGRPSRYNHHKVHNMEVGLAKTKVMSNNQNGFQREVKIKGQRLEEVENFKYLGAIISNEGSKPDILSTIAQTTTALSRLKIIRDKNISLASKVNLMRTLIVSTFLLELDLDSRTWEKDPSPFRWDAIGYFWTFPTKTMRRMRKFATESRMPLEYLINS